MRYLIILFFLSYCFSKCNAQKSFGYEHLQLIKVIDLTEVKGRIDHMTINLEKQIIYVAALGNNSIEIIDLAKGIHLATIKGVGEPQGVCYIPQTDELAVASGGNGNCIFYNATNYQINATINLKSDADNIRYDSVGKRIYVGYGNGGIAVINALTHEQIGDVKLGAHPESFQIDSKNNRLLVNLPDIRTIAVVDTRNLTVVDRWEMNDLKSNFPMTLDTVNNMVFIGYRDPALIVSYDIKTGNEKFRSVLVKDVDDIFYYESKNEILASGGGGFINIFKKENGDNYSMIANITTRSGARTSFLIPSLQTFVLAERADGGKAANLSVFKVVD